MVQSLNKKWKEFLYAFSGFGPNFLMVLMGAYFTDAINPVAFGEKAATTMQAISGVTLITPLLFSVLFTIAKAFDGIIDIPFAHLTDTLSTKWGRRRPAIAICTIPMIVSFAMCWWPIGGTENQLLNTIWIICWALVFFATYTMCLIAFYGSLSSVCTSESQRLRVSGYKSFFDTISYCLVYALVPIILDGTQLHIDKFVFVCLPLMLTIIIPLFMIKEGAKYGYPENEGLKPEKVSIWESLKLTFRNKIFLNWILVNCCTFFGLQMFLVGMNAMMIGGMNFEDYEMAIANTCAFAPVPIMLYLFNKLKAKKGVRFTYQTCLLGFAVAILTFFFGSNFIMGDGNKTIQIILACIGGVIGSWSIGAFFMMPYLVPAQISAVEEKLTGKNHSAMYFAGNAVSTSIIGAISGSLVYENIKMYFIGKGQTGAVWAEDIDKAATLLGADVSNVFNFGTLLVPFIVCFVCIAGFIIAFWMPKNYTHLAVAKELKRHNPEIDLDEVERLYPEQKEEKGEIIFVQIGLSILSGFIFGFIWLGFLLKSLKEIGLKRKTLITYLLSSFIPFASIYFMLKMHGNIACALNGQDLTAKGNKALYIITGILFPILPINVIALAVMQSDLNKLLKATKEETAEDVETEIATVNA